MSNPSALRWYLCFSIVERDLPSTFITVLLTFTCYKTFMQLSGIGGSFYVEVDELTPKTSVATQIYNLIQIPTPAWLMTFHPKLWVMLVTIAQNVKTNTSSNRNRHINRTKSCFPPPCNVAQRSISYIRSLVDGVRVWGRDLAENRRKDFCVVFIIIYLLF